MLIAKAALYPLEACGERTKQEAIMASFLGGWFGYGLGRSIGSALFGEQKTSAFESSAPIRQQTEEEIRADEKRYDEEARLLEEADRKRH